MSQIVAPSELETRTNYHLFRVSRTSLRGLAGAGLAFVLIQPLLSCALAWVRTRMHVQHELHHEVTGVEGLLHRNAIA